MELNLHHLKIFYTLVKAKTTYKAADLLSISQPSVSMQMRQFEKSIGIALFKKEGRNLILTEFGEELYKHSEKLFEIEDRIITDIKKHSSKRQVYISGHQLAISKLISSKIAKLASSSENIDFSISINSTATSLELLKQGKIDLAIIGLNKNLPYDIDESKYIKKLMLSDRLCFTHNTNFDVGDDMSVNKLNELKFVGRSKGSYSQAVLDLLEKRIMGKIKYEIKFDSAASALNYTLTNNVVYFSSYMLVEEEINKSSLKEINVNCDDFSLEHLIYAVYSKDNKSKKIIEEIFV